MAIMVSSPAQSRKLDAVVVDYRQGRLPEAAKRVRRLTKHELVVLLLANHQLRNGFLGDGPGDYDFQCFVERALAHYE